MLYNYGSNWKELSELCRQKCGYKCQKCGKSFLNDKISLHAHHIIPLSNGGRNVLSNLIALCEKCHSKEHHKTICTSKFKRKVQKKWFPKNGY